MNYDWRTDERIMEEERANRRQWAYILATIIGVWLVAMILDVLM